LRSIVNRIVRPATTHNRLFLFDMLSAVLSFNETQSTFFMVAPSADDAHAGRAFRIVIDPVARLKWGNLVHYF